MSTFFIEEAMRLKFSLQWVKDGLDNLWTLSPAFGETATAAVEAPDTVQEVASSIQDTVRGIWADFVDRIPFLVSGLAVLLFTWLAAALLSKIFARLLRRSRLRRSLQSLILRFIVIAVWIIGLLLAAMIVFPGLTPAKALGAMGIASVAIGFAFRDIFENFFAGVLLLWRFPFEIGDYIECQGISGRVEDVSIRMTTIRLISGELVVLPNSVLFKNPVEVLTSQNKRRVTIITGVAYSENVEQAVQVIENALQNCDSIKKKEEIQIFPRAFGSSSIDIEVAWWTDPLPVDIRRSRGEVVTAIKRALDDAGIEIPFPYRTLTFKDALPINVVDRAKESEKEKPD
jgi:small-conductance mechanosensitive channel